MAGRSDPDRHMDALGYLTIPAAARRARVTEQTMYAWIRKGHVKVEEARGKRYVTKDSLQQRLGPLYRVMPRQADPATAKRAAAVAAKDTARTVDDADLPAPAAKPWIVREEPDEDAG